MTTPACPSVTDELLAGIELEFRNHGSMAGFNSDQIADMAAELRTLRAENAELAKDAGRYRWLRGRLPGSAYRIAGVIYSEGGWGVDTAIDTAMEQTK